MVDFSTSIPGAVRKLANRIAGNVEIPYGGRIGCSDPEEDFRRHLRNFSLIFFPQDPRLRSNFMCSAGKTDREATPEELSSRLEQARLDLEKFGLVYAEPGDPAAFCVKWKESPATGWAEKFLRDVAEGREVRQV